MTELIANKSADAVREVVSNIQSIHRAFEILKIISQHPDSSRPGEIATQSNLPNTTVLRMLSTLEHIGAVVRLPARSTYCIGSTIQNLVNPKPSHKQLKEAARPFMQELATHTGETVYLSVEVEYQVHYVDQINTRHDILLRNWVGLSFPMHTTAPGKLLLAFWTDQKIDAFLDRPLEKYTDETITDTATIRQYITKIRSRNVAWTHGQTAEGLTGVAAPLFSNDGLLVGSISLGGPTFRFKNMGQESDIEQQIIEIAKRLSQNLQKNQIITSDLGLNNGETK